MDKNKKLIGMLLRWVYGLSWLVFPFGIVVLAIEHEKMTREEKQYMISIFVTSAVEITVSVVGAIFCSIFSFNAVAYSIVYWIFAAMEMFFGIIMLVAAIMCMCENFWKVPGAYDFAAKFLTSDAPAKTEEPKEESKEEQSENNE